MLTGRELGDAILADPENYPIPPEEPGRSTVYEHLGMAVTVAAPETVTQLVTYLGRHDPRNARVALHKFLSVHPQMVGHPDILELREKNGWPNDLRRMT